VSQPRQGEIWWAEAEAKRRPVLVVTRSEAIPILHWVIVAPITRIVRGIPTEIALGDAEGLPSESAATFDNLQPIRRSFLTRRVGELGPRRLGSALHCRHWRTVEWARITGGASEPDLPPAAFLLAGTPSSRRPGGEDARCP
jgi:mRNA interferase MazF